jgi:hypothetical protein
MSTPKVSAPEPIDRNGFLAQLLPSRGRHGFSECLSGYSLPLACLGH